MCFRLNFQMGNGSRQKLSNLLKATEDVCGGAGIWTAIEQQLRSVNVSVVGMKNMAILLFSAFGELRPVPSAWQEYVPMACFSVVLLPNGWDFQAEGLTELALSVAVSCWVWNDPILTGITILTVLTLFSVIHLGWKNHQKDPHYLILLLR